MKPISVIASCFLCCVFCLAVAKAEDEVSWERQLLLKAPTNNIDIKDLEHRAGFGDVEAQAALGVFYIVGDGIPQNFSKGFFWAQQAAAEGSVFAQYDISSAFLSGDGVEQNDFVSRTILVKLASEGMPEAQHEVALAFYTLGLRDEENFFMGVQPETMLQTNLVQAYKWIELARLNGQSVSKEKGEILEELNRTSLNYAQKLVAEFKPKPPTPLRISDRGFVVQPIPWLKWQASNDLAYAQFNLGLRYFKGDGIETNQSNALLWIGKSAAQNYPPAVEFLKTNSTVNQ